MFPIDCYLYNYRIILFVFSLHLNHRDKVTVTMNSFPGPRCMLGVASWPWKHGVALTAEGLLSPPAADTPAEPFTKRSATSFLL